MAEVAPTSDDHAAESPLSLKRLTTAFAAMLGRKPKQAGDESAENIGTPTVEISTRSITEALLFVGNGENTPLSADTLAAAMRDVAPEEIDQAVAELNAEYAADGCPFHISTSAAGYRLMLREEFDRVRDKFYGKVKQATLSPAAMEVLSVVAYRQPVTAQTLDELRGQKSQPLASSLVRRGLLRLERRAGEKRPYYTTTERFLKVFGLVAIDELPQAAEFELSFPVVDEAPAA